MDLMAESIERSYEIERSRDGLLIVGALYGKDVNNLSRSDVLHCMYRGIILAIMLITIIIVIIIIGF